jgi:hypothetical protein
MKTWQFTAAVLFVLLTTMSYLSPEQSDAGETMSRYVDDKGGITLPTDFREKWSYLGAWVVTGKKSDDEIHEVFTQPDTIVEYRKTGKFPDGAVLVKEIRTIKSGAMTTGPKVLWAGDNKIWFVMIKDSKGRFADNPNWGDGWGWALYKAGDPATNVSTNYKRDCITCHIPAKKTDWVYIQGYPTLIDSKPR